MNQSKQYSFGADRIDQILKVPLFCLEEMVIRITVITSLLENKLRILRKEESERVIELNKNYLKKVSILWN